MPVSISEPTTKREVQTREHLHDGPFRCAHCNRLEREGFGYTVEIIERGEAIPLDGVFCSEDCGIDEAMGAEIIDAYIGRRVDVASNRLLDALSPATPTGGARCE